VGNKWGIDETKDSGDPILLPTASSLGTPVNAGNAQNTRNTGVLKNGGLLGTVIADESPRNM